MSESLKPPVDNGPSFDPTGVRLEPLYDEAGKVIPIEAYMLSGRGRRTMEAFITRIIEELEDRGHLTQFLHHELAAAAQEGAGVHHPIAILASMGITQGLDDPERQKLFAENPLIYRLEAHKQRALHEGATDTPKLYGHIKIIMMNVIRHEALHGAYSPDDPIWQYLAEGFEHVKGHDYQLSHPMRMNPTTHFVPRQE